MAHHRAVLRWRGRKTSVYDMTPLRMQALEARGEAFVMDLATPAEERLYAVGLAREMGLAVWGWIEVGRDIAAANAHPEWMLQPQRSDWLSDFPEWTGGKDAAVYPWICLSHPEAFAYALERVVRLVSFSSGLDGVILNDIQGAPTACGCGGVLCRSGTASSRLFWEACVERLGAHGLDKTCIMPALCGETPATFAACSRSDWSELIGMFAESVGGPAWKAVLTPYKLFGRETSDHGDAPAAWVGKAVRSYREQDPEARIVAAIQCWNVEPSEFGAQAEQAARNGATGILILEEPIDQSWKPALAY